MRSLVVFLALLGSVVAQEKKADPLAEAKKRLHRGDYAGAQALFAEGTGPAAAIGLAEALRSEGKDAFAPIEAALKKSPDDADLLAARADLHFAAGRYAEALKDADTVIAKNPEHFRAKWVRVRVLRDTGEHAAAETEMRWFVRTYTRRSNADMEITDPDELLIVGQAGIENARRFGLGDQFKFILTEIYPDVRKADADRWEGEYFAGLMLFEKFNRPEALEAFNAALKINPRAVEAFVGKGRVALRVLDGKQAGEMAAKALAVNPKSVPALRLRADVERLAQDFPAAVVTLTEALALRPTDAETMARLSATYFQMRKPAEAEALERRIREVNPKPYLFHLERGNALLYEDLAQAERDYKAATADYPEQAAAKIGLGTVLLHYGREAEARELLATAFEKDRFHVGVSNYLKVLKHLDGYAAKLTPHYEIRHDPKEGLLAELLGEYLEELHAKYVGQFAFEPTGRVLVEVFNKHEMLSGRATAFPGVPLLGAVPASGKMLLLVSPTAEGLVKKVNWGRVTRHELTHVFNLSQTVGRSPRWFTEGMATYNEVGLRTAIRTKVLRERAGANQLFNLDDIGYGFVRPKSMEDVELAYAQSELYIRYLFATYGPASIGGLLDAYRDGLDTPTALLKVCKVEKATFEKGYKAFVREQIGGGQKSADDGAEMTLAEHAAAFKKAPADAALGVRLAERHLARNQPAEAKRVAETVLERTPENAGAIAVQAQARLKLGDPIGDELAQALKATPDDVRLLGASAAEHRQAKEWAKAAADLERARKLQPNDDRWYRELEGVYRETGEKEKRAEVLGELIRFDPEDLANRVTWAATLLELEKYPEAFQAGREVLMIDVNHPIGRKVLLTALDRLDRKDELAKWSKRFADHQPE